MSCGVAFTIHGELHALGYTGRDIDRDNLIVANDALTVTLRTFLDNDLALATTSRTSRLRLHLPKDRVGDTGNDTATFTRITRLHTLRAFRPATVTMRTRHILLHLDLLFHAVSDLFQVQLHLHTQVRSTVHPASSTRTAETTEATKTAKMSTKDVAELGEDILHGHTTTEAATL